MLGCKEEFVEEDLPSSILPEFHDSSYGFGDLGEDIKTWGNGNIDTEVAMITPASSYHPTGPSIPEFVDPRALLSQDDLQGNFSFWPAIDQQQLWLGPGTPTEIHQQPEQEITGTQHSQLQYNHASSSFMQLNSCLPLDSHSEEIITGIINRIHKNSEFACQDDSPPEPPILPRVAHKRGANKNIDEAKRLLAAEAGNKLSNKERCKLRNRVTAQICRDRKKGTLTYSP
jgi:hypothetical protein